MLITGSNSSALPPGAVKGKILLFNHKFDKELAAQGGGLHAYVGGVVYRGRGTDCGRQLLGRRPCWCGRWAERIFGCRIRA